MSAAERSTSRCQATSFAFTRRHTIAPVRPTSRGRWRVRRRCATRTRPFPGSAAPSDDVATASGMTWRTGITQGILRSSTPNSQLPNLNPAQSWHSLELELGVGSWKLELRSARIQCSNASWHVEADCLRPGIGACYGGAGRRRSAAARARRRSPPILRATFRPPERVVAVGDVHGAFDNFVAILRAAQVIDNRNRWSGRRPCSCRPATSSIAGPDSRKAIDLLRRLERDAQRAGGRVVSLLGNHELMRLISDWRYVSAGRSRRSGTAIQPSFVTRF